jgi:hypothetical protein
VHQHDMPRARADVGMEVSYYEGSGKRERKIGCVCEVHVHEGREQGVEYGVVCSEYRLGRTGRRQKLAGMSRREGT